MHDLEFFDGPTITIENNAFHPDEMHIQEGAEIKVVNNDPVDHTLTSDKGSFDEEIDAGNETEFLVPEKGEYRFYCKNHPDMEGKLIVE